MAQILVTETGGVCAAYLAPAPKLKPYDLYGQDHIEIYYISLAQLYGAVCSNKAPVVAHLGVDIQLFIRCGLRQFMPIDKDQIEAKGLTPSDLYISYAHCLNVLTSFFAQIAHQVQPPAVVPLPTNIDADTDIAKTMYWVQDLERTTRHTIARIAGTTSKEKLPKHDVAYNEVALPYIYLLYTKHITHASIRRSNHLLAKRVLWPFLSFCIEGYILYSSSIAPVFEIYRTTIMQNCLILSVNHDVRRHADAQGDELVKEEEEQKAKAIKKAEAKRKKRQQCKQRKALRKQSRAQSELALKLHDDGEAEVEMDDNVSLIIELYDDGYDKQLREMRKFYAASSLSPHAPEFIPLQH